jgi:hypothetical protein
MGIWVGNGRLFEIIYLLWWFTGPLNHLPVLDYLAMLSPEKTMQFSLIFLIGTLLLLLVSCVRRKQHL